VNFTSFTYSVLFTGSLTWLRTFGAVIEHCGLDPAHYIGLPSLAWDAMLKFTAVELELLEDRDMYLLCKQAKRGGYSGVCTLQYTARNPTTEPVLTIGPKEYTW
jgi:hypothetical protein